MRARPVRPVGQGQERQGKVGRVGTECIRNFLFFSFFFFAKQARKHHKVNQEGTGDENAQYLPLRTGNGRKEGSRRECLSLKYVCIRGSKRVRFIYTSSSCDAKKKKDISILPKQNATHERPKNSHALFTVYSKLPGPRYGDASMIKRLPSTSADAVKKPTLRVHGASGPYKSYNIDKTHSCSRKCDRRRLQGQLRRRHWRSR